MIKKLIKMIENLLTLTAIYFIYDLAHDGHGLDAMIICLCTYFSATINAVMEN
jgi:hypothetical protein